MRSSWKRLLHIKNEFNVKMFIYIYICVHKEITCQLSWRSDKNLLKEKKESCLKFKKFWISCNSFQILFFLIDQSRFFSSWTSGKNLLKEKQKESCLNFKKFWISCNSFQILFFLIDQSRFFSSWTSDKNLFSFSVKKNLAWTSRLKRILADQPEKQESGKNDGKNVD